MNNTLERHNIEDKHREALDIQHELAWIPFYTDAVDQMVEEIQKKKGDPLTLMTELSEGFDEFEILDQEEINKIMFDSYKRVFEKDAS